MASRIAEKPEISPEEYGEFLQGIELRRIYLVDTRVKRKRSPSLEAVLRFNQDVVKSKFSKIEDGFTATFSFQVQLLEDDNEAPFADLMVSYVAEYSSEQKMTKKIFEIFGQYNLPLNLYPYVREYIHTTTNRMGLPSLVLPVLKASE